MPLHLCSKIDAVNKVYLEQEDKKFTKTKKR